MNEFVRRQHAWRNRWQSGLLLLTLFAINALAAMLLLGDDGLWLALALSVLAGLIEPRASMALTLRLYRAQPLAPAEAPQLWRITALLAQRAGLANVPQLHYLLSPVANAFAVGSQDHSAIALSDGLLRRLDQRQLTGVLAHEIAHIAHADLRVMSLADFVGRLTGLYALAGQALLLLALPGWLLGWVEIEWSALLLLVVAPWLALLVQMGLSRVREFDADQAAAALTGDPLGLAAALAKIEQGSRSWRDFFPPGWGRDRPPSWLRSHPPTAERIRRLHTLARPTPKRYPLPRRLPAASIL